MIWESVYLHDCWNFDAKGANVFLAPLFYMGPVL